MYNFQIVNNQGNKIKEGLKLRVSFNEANKKDFEKPKIEKYKAYGRYKSQKFQKKLDKKYKQK